MSIERSLLAISRKTTRSSSILRNEIQSSVSLQRVFEKKSLRTRKKLVEERRATLLALSNQAGKKDSGSGGVGGLLGILGLGGGSRLLRSFRGGPKGGGGGGLRFFGRGPRGGGGPKITYGRGTQLARGAKGIRGGLGPLAVLTTGLDFMGRKAEGQTNLQAGVGAGGGLAGALAGGAAGAKAGAVVGGSIGALFGGVGAAPGAAIGGFIGGVGGSIIGSGIGSGIADFITGADGRRKIEEKRVIAMTTKSSFSHALDDFDRILNKLERVGANRVVGGRDKDEEGGGFRNPFTVPGTPWWRNPWVNLGGGVVMGIIATLIPFDAIGGDIVAWANVARLARKIPILRKLLKLKSASKSSIVLQKKGELALVRKNWFDAGRAKAFWRSLMDMGKSFRTPNVEIERRVLDAQLMVNKIRAVVQPSKTMRMLEKFVKKWKIFQKTLNQKKLPPQGGTTKIPRTITKKFSKGSSATVNVNANKGTTIPTKADGGPVIAGKPYIVGEIGEELFIPEEDGYIVSNADLPASEVLVINNGADTVYIPHVNNIGGVSGSRKSGPNSYSVAAKYAEMAQLLTT